MTEIFISYARADRDRAKSFAEAVAGRGYSLWWDVELLPGENFIGEINRALAALIPNRQSIANTQWALA